MLFTYFYKTKFTIDEHFNAKGIQNNGIWNHTAKDLQNKLFLNLPRFRFRLPFKNGTILVKTLSTATKYNKIPRAFLNQVFIINFIIC